MQLFQNWLKPQVVLLDVGMATELTGDDRNNMLALFQGFSELDGAAMAEATLRFAGKAQRCLNPEGFRNAIAKCDPWFHTLLGLMPTAALRSCTSASSLHLLTAQ